MAGENDEAADACTVLARREAVPNGAGDAAADGAAGLRYADTTAILRGVRLMWCERQQRYDAAMTPVG